MQQHAWLEPVLRQWRLQRVIKAIPKGATLLDIGCGPHFLLLKTVAALINQGYGLDFKVQPQQWQNITLQQLVLDEALPFEDNSIDCVTMLAVLEHIEAEQAIVKEVYRVLKPGGTFVLTVPSIWAQPVLEFLAFRLKWVEPLEILDHKRYYNRQVLVHLLREKTGFHPVKHQYFQLFMNNFCIAHKRHVL